jgi:hypothetical protein
MRDELVRSCVNGGLARLVRRGWFVVAWALGSDVALGALWCVSLAQSSLCSPCCDDFALITKFNVYIYIHTYVQLVPHTSLFSNFIR